MSRGSPKKDHTIPEILPEACSPQRMFHVRHRMKGLI